MPAEGGRIVRPQEAAPAYHPRTDLTPEHQEVERRFHDLLFADPEESLRRYSYLPETLGGQVISADEVKKLSPDFQQDGSLANAVHEPSSQFADWKYRRSLSELPPGGYVALLAGGPGSGKSTVLKKEGLANGVGLVYDAIMADPKAARERIRLAHEAGQNVVIDYVHCPIEKMVRQAVKRAMDPESGFRTVPLDYIAKKAFLSQHTNLGMAV